MKTNQPNHKPYHDGPGGHLRKFHPGSAITKKEAAGTSRGKRPRTDQTDTETTTRDGTTTHGKVNSKISGDASMGAGGKDGVFSFKSQ